MVSTPLKNISQLVLSFPIYGKIKNASNHQPEIVREFALADSPGSLAKVAQVARFPNASCAIRAQSARCENGYGVKDAAQELKYEYFSHIFYQLLWVQKPWMSTCWRCWPILILLERWGSVQPGPNMWKFSMETARCSSVQGESVGNTLRSLRRWCPIDVLKTAGAIV